MTIETIIEEYEFTYDDREEQIKLIKQDKKFYCVYSVFNSKGEITTEKVYSFQPIKVYNRLFEQLNDRFDRWYH